MTATRSRRLFIGILIMILAAGFALRFYRFALPGARADAANPLSTLPPGLDSDEAFHTLAALRLTTGGEIVPFFKIDQGIPAAMIYLIALVFQVAGPAAEGGRIASQIAGAFMLIALPLFARNLFPDLRAAAFFTAAHVAFTFWFVNFSRIGLEQMTAAALMTLAVVLSWLWQTSGGWKWAAASGGALGLALYSYPAAYFLPVAVASVALYSLTLARPRWKPNWREGALCIAALALVAAPLVIFFAQNPEWATRRAAQVATESFTPARLPQNALGAVGGLLWHGDEITRHNIPGKPLLDPIQIIFFAMGLAYCLRRWREAPFGLLLIWLGVMLFPAALSANPEHFGRLAGSVAAVMLIAGVGGAAVWQKFPRPITGIALGIAVLFSAINTAYNYFVLWPQTPGYLDVFDFPERVQAEAIESKPDAAAYLTPSDRARPMFAFLWHDAPRAQSFNGRECSVAPAHTERETIWLINVIEDTQTANRLATLYPQIESATLFAANGTPIVNAMTLPSGLTAQLPPGRVGRVNDLAELISARELSPPLRGREFPIQLLWQVIGATGENWTVGLYLLDGESQVKAQDDHMPCDNSYLTSVWQPGEVIVEDRRLAIPPELPSGEYALGIAFYRLSDGARLPVFDSTGAEGGTLLKIMRIMIP